MGYFSSRQLSGKGRVEEGVTRVIFWWCFVGYFRGVNGETGISLKRVWKVLGISVDISICKWQFAPRNSNVNCLKRFNEN